MTHLLCIIAILLQFLLSYPIVPSSVPSSITLTGTFIARPDRVDVQYSVSGVPTGYVTNWGGSQFRFILSNKANTQILPEAKLGLWQRDAQGGLPIEAADSNFFPFLVKDKIICLAYGPENKANSSWKDDWYRHGDVSKLRHISFFYI